MNIKLHLPWGFKTLNNEDLNFKNRLECFPIMRKFNMPDNNNNLST